MVHTVKMFLYVYTFWLSEFIYFIKGLHNSGAAKWHLLCDISNVLGRSTRDTNMSTAHSFSPF